MMLRHWPSAWMWLCTVLHGREASRPGSAMQLVVHAQEVLADDVQVRLRQQVVDVGDAAGDRVLDRDHGERGLAVVTAAKASSKVGARQRLAVRDRPRGRRGASWRRARPERR